MQNVDQTNPFGHRMYNEQKGLRKSDDVVILWLHKMSSCSQSLCCVAGIRMIDFICFFRPRFNNIIISKSVLGKKMRSFLPIFRRRTEFRHVLLLLSYYYCCHSCTLTICIHFILVSIVKQLATTAASFLTFPLGTKKMLNFA